MRIKLIVILLFSQIMSFGQSSDFLVDTNKIWSHLHISPDLGDPSPHTWTTDFITFRQDTIININHYKKVFHALDSNHLVWGCIGFIREDSASKVFYKSVQDSSERLLYDFGAQVGDTVTIDNGLTFDLIVDSIDSIFVYNKYMKRILFQMSPEIWIEGIGSMAGVLQSGLSLLTGQIDELLCYYENDTLKLSNTYYQECFYNNVGINEIEKNEIKTKLYPNPVVGTSTFLIEGNPDKKYFVLEIYSVIGTRIKTIIINNDKQTVIRKSDFSSGLYFYKLTSHETEIKTGKFEIE